MMRSPRVSPGASGMEFFMKPKQENGSSGGKSQQGNIVAPEEDGYALNRSLFYAAVKEEFESYLRELRDPANKELRQRFKEKMDELCGEA